MDEYIKEMEGMEGMERMDIWVEDRIDEYLNG